MSDDELHRTSQLSSICDELRSTAQQRGQELYTISQLLEGIKQLQSAQQFEPGEVDEHHAAGDAHCPNAAAVDVAQQLDILQETALLQSLHDGTLQQTAANEAQAMPSIPSQRDRTATAQPSVQSAADAADKEQQGQTWPQTALLQLLEEAHSSGSTKGNAVCGASSGSSSPSSSPLLQLGQNSKQVGMLHPRLQAVSKFSFPAAGAAEVIQYITPLKIPRPVKTYSTRCSNIDSNSSDCSSIASGSSGRGSYVAQFFQDQRGQIDGSNTDNGSQANQSSSLHMQQRHEPPSAPGPNPAAAAHQNGRQASVSPNPLPSTTSSMSTEAAALMQALRAAAQQREAAREVLQARSSIATTAFTRNTPTPTAGSPVDWGYTSGEDEHADGRQLMQCPQQAYSAVVAQTAAAAGQGPGLNLTGGMLPGQLAGAAAATAHTRCTKHKLTAGADAPCQQRGRLANGTRRWLSPSTSPSPQTSVVGPKAYHSSGNSSVHRSQRAAVDRLMQEAIESSSMSSLMALLDSQAASEDEGELQSSANAEANTDAVVHEPRAAAATEQSNALPGNANSARTWGSSSSSIPPNHTSNSADSDRKQNGASANTALQNGWPDHQEHGSAEPAQPWQHRRQRQEVQQQQQGQARLQSGRTSPALSGAGSELQYDALSAELEMLSSQVEQERQQLEQLQQQRQLMEQQLTQPTVPAASGGTHHPHQPQPQQQWRQQHGHSDMSMCAFLPRQQQHPARRSRSCSDLATAGTPVPQDSGSKPAIRPTRAVNSNLNQAQSEQQQASSAGPGASSDPQPAVQQCVEVADACSQAGTGVIVVTEEPQGVDVSCQALLLHVSGLPAVGPPSACRVCPAVQQQLRGLQQKLEKAQEKHKQAQLSAEQSRHQAMTAEAQLALNRQKVRAVLSANAKPLAMSGWEDLIEEAAADLERIEGHVSAAAERLIELQAASTSAAEALIGIQREADRQLNAAAAAALKTEELQQQAEGLIAVISSNQHSNKTSQQQLKTLQQQLEEQQAATEAAEQQLKRLQEQVQQLQQQVATTEQQVADKERSRQQLLADLSERQHQLQVTRGDCASAQDRLSQVQTSLIEGRQQLDDVQQQQRQQQRLYEETGKQLAALQAQRTAAAAEAAGAQQELNRVLRELEQCQQDIQAAELQHAELEEATAEKQQQHEQHSKVAAAAQQQREKLQADVAAAKDELQQLQQAAQAAKHEAELCTRAAATADRQLHQVQQTLTALQAGAAQSATHRAVAPADTHNAAAAVTAAATAHMAECAQLQVKLAAAESRRQLAEERAEESDRRLQQLKTEVSSLRTEHESTERQLRQVSAKCDKLRDKLQQKCENLSEVQGQLQQAQQQLHDLSKAAANARAQAQPAGDSKALAAASSQAEGQQLLQSYQQRLKELEADVTAARSQLQHTEQQLEQQRKANSNLQQQLSATQQQLVQAQQLLLELPKQHSSGTLSQQQADQMQMAVRSSIQGLHEAFGLHAKLQHAQVQAETAKQQLQEVQQEKKQLQKKLAAYKQQLSELKTLIDSQQLMKQQQQQQASSSADSANAVDSSSSKAAHQLEVLQTQHRLLTDELATAQQQLSQSQQQLQWANREAEHLKQLMQQQQEISHQLRGEVQRLQDRQQQQATVDTSQDAQVQPSGHVESDESSPQAAAAAVKLVGIQGELAAARQQLLQAQAECNAAKHAMDTLQQQLATAEQLQQQQVQQLRAAEQLQGQHMQQLTDLKQQLQHKDAELSQRAQQLVQQQQEHKWQQVQWEQKLQAAEQQACQELLDCRTELASNQAAVSQLQTAAALLEQQLAAAVKAVQKQHSGDVHGGISGDSSREQEATGVANAASTAASSPGDLGRAADLAKAGQLVKQLANACSAAVTARSQLQQQLRQQQEQLEQKLQQQKDLQIGQVQQLLKAVEASELHRQEAELLQLQLQQKCQLLQMQHQQKQQKQLQDKQGQLPGHMQSMASVAAVMEQLHVATQQSIMSSAAAWGASSCGVLRGSAVPGATAVSAAAGAATTFQTTPVPTPHMSMENLGGLAPPASCLSPLLPSIQPDILAGPASNSRVRPAAARGLQYCIASEPEKASSQAGIEVAQLRQRLVQLSQDMINQLQNPGASQRQQQQGPGRSPASAAPVSPAAAAADKAADADVALGDAELQRSWAWLQEQAAGHDRLMQHMRQMWSQAFTLAQHCMALQAAAAETAEPPDSRPHVVQHGIKQQVQQQQQRQRTQQPSSPQLFQASDKLDKETFNRNRNSQSALAFADTAVGGMAVNDGATAQALLTAAEPLLVLAQQLQQDITALSDYNKHLLDAANKLSSSFRSGGRAVRVRALALRLDLQSQGISAPAAGAADQQQKQPAGQAAAAAGSTGAALPADVAVSVVQHWNEVETLLAQLHQSCEGLLLAPATVGQRSPKQQQPAQGASSTSTRKHAMRSCKKLLQGLEQLIAMCQQQQHGLLQSPQLGVQLQRHSSPAGMSVAAPLPPQLTPTDNKQPSVGDGLGNKSYEAPLQTAVKAPVRGQKGQQQPIPSANRHDCNRSSCSSSSSEGLGSLLAMVQSRLAAEDAKAALHGIGAAGRATADAAGLGARQVSKQAHCRGYVTEGRVPLQPRQLQQSGYAVAEPHVEGPIKRHRSTSRGRRRHPARQPEGGAAELAERPRSGHSAVGRAGLKLSVGDPTSSWGQVDVASSANIRRAERAVLMERLKALQQQQHQ